MSTLTKIIFGVITFGLGVGTGGLIAKNVLDQQHSEDLQEAQDWYQEQLENLGYYDDDKVKIHGPEDIKEVFACHKGEVEHDHRKPINYAKPSLEELYSRSILGDSVIVDADGDESLGEVDPEYVDAELDADLDIDLDAELDADAEAFARRQTENFVNFLPYIIGPEDYRDAPEEYDRQALYYYAKDRVLCEDDDTQIDDEEGSVGLDYEDVFDTQTTCWVRNDRLQVVYEIHRINDSYEKSVLGVMETPREREFRIQGRRKQALDD